MAHLLGSPVDERMEPQWNINKHLELLEKIHNEKRRFVPVPVAGVPEAPVLMKKVHFQRIHYHVIPFESQGEPLNNLNKVSDFRGR
ncbi:UNVERIFIED_CONTAM: hypothetical protein RMT77_009082 [Armadillidium vulgare]